MYYSLSTDGRENTYMEKEPGLNSHIELAMGRTWDINRDEIDLPYRYIMSAVEGQTPRLYAWYPGSDLMQERLVSVLHSLGVDNMQTFPVEIRREAGEEIPGFVVVNIIGRISCANMDRSEYEPLADVYYFHQLTIDPTLTNGLLMFRLHEAPNIVLVHEKIARAIEAGGFLGLTLDPVEEAPRNLD